MDAFSHKYARVVLRCAVSPRLPGLHMLNLGGAEGACDEAMEAVGAMTQLTSLDASEFQRLTAAGGAHLARLPVLADLSLGWNLSMPRTRIFFCSPYHSSSSSRNRSLQ
jgi:hypothetical protein